VYTLARHSNRKASTPSLHKGNVLRVKQDILVYVSGRKTLIALLNQRRFNLQPDEVLCVLRVIAPVQLYFTAEERPEILKIRPSILSTKAVA
jgi:hypothetical protein